MSKVKVDYYAVEIPYLGNFNNNDVYDLLDMAKLQYVATNMGYDYSEYVSERVGAKLDGEFTVENTDPEHHICTVFWAELDEEYDGRTEEEKNYDAECEWSNHLQDLADDDRLGV